MMNSVKRWQPEIVMDGKKPRIHIREWDFGIYVAHEDYAALAERVRVLEECLGSLMSFIDKGMLVRDVSRDYEQGWHLKMLPLVQALSKAKALLAQPAQSGDTDTQADASEEGRDAQ